MTRSTLEELLARCERATGPDRNIDAALFCLVHNFVGLDIDLYDSAGPRTYANTAHGKSIELGDPIPAYSSSIDAIVGLIVKEYPPGPWHWYVDDRTAAIWPDGTYDESTVNAATPALALCVAFLSRKLSLPGGDE